MKIITFLLACLMAVTSFSSSADGVSDDPLLMYFKADKLEWRDSDEGDLLVWELDAWIGKDLNKLWIKSRGEHLDSDTERSEIDILYSRAISPFWDLQVGLRHEFRPKPSQDWLGFGFKGIAPYLFEVDANIFVNDDSQINARLEIEYEYMLSQKLVLVPNLELSIYSDNDNDREITSGLSLAELGLRLHYEIKREFSPYIGINFEKKFGNSEVEESSESQLVLGLSFWL
jgi:copper resistance protein B